MAVQPTATGAANTRTTNGEQDSMIPPLSPYTVELNRVLLEHRVQAWRRLSEQERRLSWWDARQRRHQRHRRHLPLQYDLRPDQPLLIQPNVTCRARRPSNLGRVLLEALSEPPASETTLSNATTAIKAGCVTSTSASTQTAWTAGSFCRLGAGLDLNDTPARTRGVVSSRADRLEMKVCHVCENGGAWDAFDAATMDDVRCGNNLGGIERDAFVSDDSLA